MSTTYIGENIIVHIEDVQLPSWVWTREAKIAWMTYKPWRMKAQDATVGAHGYQQYRAYLLKQAYQMFGAHTSISDEPTDKVPAIRNPLTLPTQAEGRGLLTTIYNEDTVKVRVVR